MIWLQLPKVPAGTLFARSKRHKRKSRVFSPSPCSELCSFASPTGRASTWWQQHLALMEITGGFSSAELIRRMRSLGRLNVLTADQCTRKTLSHISILHGSKTTRLG